jgi:hypothetical protein
VTISVLLCGVKRLASSAGNLVMHKGELVKVRLKVNVVSGSLILAFSYFSLNGLVARNRLCACTKEANMCCWAVQLVDLTHN